MIGERLIYPRIYPRVDRQKQHNPDFLNRLASDTQALLYYGDQSRQIMKKWISPQMPDFSDLPEESQDILTRFDRYEAFLEYGGLSQRLPLEVLGNEIASIMQYDKIPDGASDFFTAKYILRNYESMAAIQPISAQFESIRIGNNIFFTQSIYQDFGYEKFGYMPESRLELEVKGDFILNVLGYKLIKDPQTMKQVIDKKPFDFGKNTDQIHYLELLRALQLQSPVYRR